MSLIIPTAEDIEESLNEAAEQLVRMQSIISVKVEYFDPDFPSVVNPNPFFWQTDDIPPFPRIKDFLLKWGLGPDDVIKTAISKVWLWHHVTGHNIMIQPGFRHVDHEFRVN